MNLNEYLEEMGIPITVFARKAKVHPKTIYNLLKGHDVYLSSAMTVCRATKGKVSILDIVKRYEEINS